MTLPKGYDRGRDSRKEYDDKNYIYTIRSRLQKKLRQFASQELPILLEKGYLTEFRNVTENSNALVAQPDREKEIHETEQKSKP